MSSSSGLTKILALSAVALASWLMLASPATAQPVARSFYQNAGASCHGVDALNDSKLSRTENRLLNKSNSSVDVVCNLPTDAYANIGTNSGVVSYVALWARRFGGSNKSMTCTMTDGFFGQTGSGVRQPNSPNPRALPNSGAQAIFEWSPASGEKFLGPINLRCTLEPATELNDWFVKYQVNDNISIP